MNFSSFEPRDSLSVPSMKCQSLLGKAVQEHFTKPEQVASVFSSSPSLQNSSVGANVLTNFKIDKSSFILFQTVFTPDCFSTQFIPSLNVSSKQVGGDERTWENIFSFLQNFITKNGNYLAASLRSLEINSEHISDQQLHFLSFKS